MAMTAAEHCSESHKAGRTLLDVGSGVSLFGPTMALNGWCVRECDSDPNWAGYRAAIKKVIAPMVGSANFTNETRGIDNLPNEEFDMVSCISVLEHVNKNLEKDAYGMLADRVKLGGLLFITVDCMRCPSEPHVFDNLRATNYTIEEFIRRFALMLAFGRFNFLEEHPDYEYHGNHVHDYTFMSAALRRVR